VVAIWPNAALPGGRHDRLASVGINAMILSLLLQGGRARRVTAADRLKMLEMSVYEGISPAVPGGHRHAGGSVEPVCGDGKRYKLMSKQAGAKAGYNVVATVDMSPRRSSAQPLSA
jgi:DNA segregation ATPase FtsK/SpoIIIE-like protein